MDATFRIDTLPLGLPSGLGLSRLPGYEPGTLGRDVEHVHASGFRMVVSLVDTKELHWLPGLDDAQTGLFAVLRARGLSHLHFPIRNLGVPEDAQALAPVIDSVLASLREGQPVLVHCMAGLGRTGLFAACCLRRLGVGASEALRVVRTARPGTVETPEQELFVARFEAR